MRIRVKVDVDQYKVYEINREISKVELREFQRPQPPDSFTFGGSPEEFTCKMVEYSRQMERHIQFRDMLAADLAMALANSLTSPEELARSF